MGACSFSFSYTASSLSEAYRNAVADAKDEYGNDPYNGTISTTDGITDLTAEFKRSKMSANEFVDKNIERARKWGNALGICIEEPVTNKNKVKSVVTNMPNTGTLKWVTNYVVYARMDNVIGSCLKKADAIKKAREHTEKTKERCDIYIEKKLTNGKARVAEVSYKSSPNEKAGKYILFGIAAE